MLAFTLVGIHLLRSPVNVSMAPALSKPPLGCNLVCTVSAEIRIQVHQVGTLANTSLQCLYSGFIIIYAALLVIHQMGVGRP